MKFKHVVIKSLAAVEPPIRVTSREIEQKLAPTLARLGIRDNLLEDVSGIGARRFWERGTSPSDAATLAAEKALDMAGIDRAKIGVIINTSVCRDYLEPSTACIVHGNLGLAEDCLNFDVGNACLAFMNGMDIAARMIERAEIEYALIVDGESSRPITEATIEHMLQPDISADQFRAEFASLTLGSGAAAMVMARRELAPDGHAYLGSVSRAAIALARFTSRRLAGAVRAGRVGGHAQPGLHGGQDLGQQRRGGVVVEVDPAFGRHGRTTRPAAASRPAISSMSVTRPTRSSSASSRGRSLSSGTRSLSHRNWGPGSASVSCSIRRKYWRYCPSSPG